METRRGNRLSEVLVMSQRVTLSLRGHTPFNVLINGVSRGWLVGMFSQQPRILRATKISCELV